MDFRRNWPAAPDCPGSAAGTIGYLCALAAPSWEWVMVAVLFSEMSVSLVAPSYQAYIAENAPEGKTASTFGLVEAMFVLCMIIGPLLGGFLVHTFDYKTMVAAATVIYATATLMRLAMARHATAPVRPLNPAALVADLRKIMLLFAGGGLLLWIFAVDGLIDAGMQLALPFLPQYVTRLENVNEATYGILSALMAVIAMLVLIPAGRLSDRWGEHTSLALGVSMMGLAWLILAQFQALPVFALVFATAGAADAFIRPALSSIISQAVPKESLGIVWGCS
ncbi:MAG: MFS transporter [Anaerolineae bacterium]|nr:MFS transporter [Anaerolineae bacterium]